MDKMEIEILQDGTLKITNDQVSMPNHTNAEGLIRALVTGMGGQATVQRRNPHAHHHHHEHDHVHEGGHDHRH